MILSRFKQFAARSSAVLSVLCAGIIVAFVLPLPKRDALETVAGTPRVVDGDSLEFGQLRLRLRGIDAPELHQECNDRQGRPFACGRIAKDHLKSLVGARRVTCTADDLDKYGRRLGTCAVGDTDIGRQMVADGWAVSYGGYFSQEGRARRERRGIWDGDFDAPARWREKHPR